jgi:hypothetical protein
MEHPNRFEPPHVDPATTVSSRRFSSDYAAAFKFALILQCCLGIFTALLLDFGIMHRAFWAAFLCQWSITSIIFFRRPSNPTALDLGLIRYAIVPLTLAIAPIYQAWAFGSTEK